MRICSVKCTLVALRGERRYTFVQICVGTSLQLPTEQGRRPLQMHPKLRRGERTAATRRQHVGGRPQAVHLSGSTCASLCSNAQDGSWRGYAQPGRRARKAVHDGPARCVCTGAAPPVRGGRRPCARRHSLRAQQRGSQDGAARASGLVSHACRGAQADGAQGECSARRCLSWRARCSWRTWTRRRFSCRPSWRLRPWRPRSRRQPCCGRGRRHRARRQRQRTSRAVGGRRGAGERQGGAAGGRRAAHPLPRPLHGRAQTVARYPALRASGHRQVTAGAGGGDGGGRGILLSDLLRSREQVGGRVREAGGQAQLQS